MSKFIPDRITDPKTLSKFYDCFCVLCDRYGHPEIKEKTFIDYQTSYLKLKNRCDSSMLLSAHLPQNKPIEVSANECFVNYLLYLEGIAGIGVDTTYIDTKGYVICSMGYDAESAKAFTIASGKSDVTKINQNSFETINFKSEEKMIDFIVNKLIPIHSLVA